MRLPGMSGRARWVLLVPLVLACSASDAPDRDVLPAAGSGGAPSEGWEAGAGGAPSSADPDAGLTPASAGAAGLPNPECALSQRRHFEDRGFLAAGTLRGLLESLNEPEAFWEQLPDCSGVP